MVCTETGSTLSCHAMLRERCLDNVVTDLSVATPVSISSATGTVFETAVSV